MSETTVELKGVGALEIKNEDKGEVEAVIATLGVVDKDGDVIVAGSIPSGAKVKMSSYGHNVVFGEIPVGKGTLDIRGDKAVFKGRMFLTTQRGREVFDVLKEMGSDQEWSFGFKVRGAEVPDDEWRAKGAARMLTKLDAFEVSPVLEGAGIGTHTVGVKEASEPEPVDETVTEVEPEEVEGVEAEGAEAPEMEAESESEADDEAEAKAAQDEADRIIEIERKARAASAKEEYDRVQRTLKRLGVA